MKCSSEMLQNLLQSMYKKTHPGLFVFHYKQLYILPCECPGLCQFTPGHSKGENVKLHKTSWISMSPCMRLANLPISLSVSPKSP